MAECEWPEDRVLDLIRHIRQHPCLWHSRDPNRLNKARKAACYALIANGFGLTPQEVKKKFANLMQTYRGCRRKIRSSGRSGRCPNYKPVWFAYDAINHFMEGHYTPHDELHPMDNIETVLNFDKLSSRSSKVDYNEDSDVEDLIEEEIIKDEDIESPEIVHEEEMADSGTEPKGRIFVTPLSQLTEDKGHLKEVVQRQPRAKRKRGSKRKDEYSLFGRLVAIRLKKMDEMTRQYVMNDINSIMFRASVHSASHVNASSSDESHTAHSQRSALRNT